MRFYFLYLVYAIDSKEIFASWNEQRFSRSNGIEIFVAVEFNSKGILRYKNYL